MSTPGTTNWYAFKDPKTGREYYNEPVSGKTTWVLPTSSRSHSEKGGNANIPRSTMNESNTIKKEKLTNQRKQMGRWIRVGIWTFFILLLNTVFLLVLVSQRPEKNRQSVTEQNHTNVHSLDKTPDEISVDNDVDDPVLMQMEAPNSKPALNDKSFLSSTVRDDSDVVHVVNDPSANNDPSVKNRVGEESDSRKERPSSRFDSSQVAGDSDSQYGDTELDDSMYVSDSKDSIPDEELAHEENPSFRYVNDDREEKDNKKSVDVELNRDKSTNIWIAILVKRSQQFRLFFARIFDRVSRVGRWFISRRRSKASEGRSAG